MSDLGNRLHHEYENLKTRRDELRVQIDPGKMEARDLWESLDEKWGEFEQKMKLFTRVSRDAASEVGNVTDELVEDAKTGLRTTRKEGSDAAGKLVKEIRDGYEQLRRWI